MAPVAAGRLGQFLEISIYAPDVPASMDFYRRLGLSEAVTGDVWDHAYAVMTDGQVALGLHAYEFPSPALTWACPGIPEAARRLQAAGIELEFEKTGEERFNELGFLDPDGQMITLLEARTFSPPPGRLPPPAAGFFRELRYPVRLTAETTAFWEALGFVATETRPDRAVLTGDGLALLAYASRRREPPSLAFEAVDLDAAAAALEARGLSGTRGDDPVTGAPALLLTAPEGTPVTILAIED